MNKFTVGCLGFLLSLAQLGTAQQISKADYLILHSGDTLRGEIQVPKFVSENGVRFRPSPDSRFKTYLPSEVREFTLADGQHFVKRQLVLARRAQVDTRTPSDAQDLVGVFLQQLTRGAARLYRLNYNQNTQPTAMEYTGKETVFFLMETAPAGLRILEQNSFRNTLRSMFEGCAAAQDKLTRTRFEEDALVELALNYGSCAPTLPATDLRRALIREKLQYFYSLRAGIARSRLAYSNTTSLQRQNVTPSTGLLVGLYVDIRKSTPLSFGAGLQYAVRQSEGNELYVVPAGYSNAGTKLNLHTSVDFKTLQLPIWLRYSATRSRFFPYLAVGPSIGFLFANNTTLGQAKSTFDPSSPFISSLKASEINVREVAEHINLTMSGHVTLGIRPQFGRFVPVLEVGYELGRDLNDSYLGTLSYRGLTARAGVEF